MRERARRVLAAHRDGDGRGLLRAHPDRHEGARTVAADEGCEQHHRLPGTVDRETEHTDGDHVVRVGAAPGTRRNGTRDQSGDGERGRPPLRPRRPPPRAAVAAGLGVVERCARPPPADACSSSTRVRRSAASRFRSSALAAASRAVRAVSAGTVPCGLQAPFAVLGALSFLGPSLLGGVPLGGGPGGPLRLRAERMLRRLRCASRHRVGQVDRVEPVRVQRRAASLPDRTAPAAAGLVERGLQRLLHLLEHGVADALPCLLRSGRR